MDECKNLLSSLKDALKNEQLDSVNRTNLLKIDVLEKVRRALIRSLTFSLLPVGRARQTMA